MYVPEEEQQALKDAIYYLENIADDRIEAPHINKEDTIILLKSLLLNIVLDKDNNA